MLSPQKAFFRKKNLRRLDPMRRQVSPAGGSAMSRRPRRQVSRVSLASAIMMIPAVISLLALTRRLACRCATRSSWSSRSRCSLSGAHGAWDLRPGQRHARSRRSTRMSTRCVQLTAAPRLHNGSRAGVMEVTDEKPPVEVNAAEFRHAMGHFATGVTIVTSVGADGEPVGRVRGQRPRGPATSLVGQLRPPGTVRCLG